MKRINYIPTIKFNKRAYIAIIVLFILLLGGLQWQKNGGFKIGDTMLMMADYNQKVDLSTGDRETYEAEVQKNDDLINSFMLGTGANIGNRTNTEQERFLKKAENLALLGQNNTAIRTLIKALKYYPDSPWILDMLGNIYAHAGAYQRALNLFEKIIVLDPNSTMTYAKPIMEMYVGLGEADKAGKLYIEYIKNGGTQDADLINKIRVARGLDPM